MNKGIFLGAILVFTLVYFVEIDQVRGAFLGDDDCETRTQCTYRKLVVNESTGSHIPQARCNMTVYDPDGILIQNYNMTNRFDGWYELNLTFTREGQYPADCACQYTNLNDQTDVANCTFAVVSAQNYNNLLHALFIIIPLGLIWLSRYTQDLSYATLGSLLLFAFGIIIYRGNLPYLQFNSGLLTNALAMTVIGLAMYFGARVIQEWWFTVED